MHAGLMIFFFLLAATGLVMIVLGMRRSEEMGQVADNMVLDFSARSNKDDAPFNLEMDRETTWIQAKQTYEPGIHLPEPIEPGNKTKK